MDRRAGECQNPPERVQIRARGAEVLPLHDPNAVIPRHLDWLAARNLRPNTIRQRRNLLLRLRHFWPDVRLVDMDEKHVSGFINRPGLAPSSRAVELTQIAPFFRWCVSEGLMASDPTLKIHRPKRRKSLPRPIADGQLQLALEYAPPVRIKPALLFAAYAGLRACEIAPLHTDDLRRLDRPAMILIREEKGGSMGSVPLSPILDAALGACDLPKAGWLFPYHDPGRGDHLTATYVSKLCNDYLRSVDIADTLHSLRHWYGTHTYRASGRDIRQTQNLMRHKHVGSTEIYTWVDPGEAASIVGRLPTF